jgi:cell division protein FtsL
MQLLNKKPESCKVAGATAISAGPGHPSSSEYFYASPWPAEVRENTSNSSPSAFAVLVGILRWWKETYQLAAELIHFKTLVTIILLLLVIVSGVSAVYAVHLNRQLFIDLQALQSEQDQAQRLWTQLLLEESAWNDPNRVEHIASGKLGMMIPAAEQVEMVK